MSLCFDYVGKGKKKVLIMQIKLKEKPPTI